MAVGHRPFSGHTDLELSSAILKDPPAALPTHVSPTLALIVQKCLAKEPSERYQQARDVRAALEAVPSDPQMIPAETPRGVRLRSWPLVTVAAVVVLLAAPIGLNVGGWRDRVLGRSSAAQPNSLAVLPLENLSGDPEQDYFADGMTDALIGNLVQMGALKVISRTSAMRYKNTAKTLPEIARELGVDAVIEGSVLRSGDRVRIMAQLIDGRTDRHLWASSYERDLRDVLTLQREVARAIAEEILVKLTPEQQARFSPVSPVTAGAYDAYLRGRYSWNIWSEQGFRKGIVTSTKRSSRTRPSRPPTQG